MPITLFALILVLLLSAAPSVAAAGPASGDQGVGPDALSAFTPEAPPEACRDCGELRYYRPMKKSEKAKTLDPRFSITNVKDRR
ncbi:MAG: hypothetical protein OXF97_03530 [Nitrospira sp.]|nr:hypothetical protein [Nitrospira sp.]MCY3955584.1 hypothetical protein [Nitrospira sp.]